MSAPAFHSLVVSDVRRETADAVSVRFAVPPQLREAYRFTQGQFVTLKARVGGEELRRSYSVCCAVSDYERAGELRVGIKRIEGGRFSTFANEGIEVGAALEVMTPDGRFFAPLDPAAARHHVAFAGGSGITPILSIMKTVLEAEPASRFTLVYGNRAVGAIMFAEELEGLKNRYLGRLALYHVLSDEPQEVELFNGMLDGPKCAQFLDFLIAPASIDVAYICGPGPMMDAAEAALKGAGVAPSAIRVERFGTPPLAGAGGKEPPQAGARPAAPVAGGKTARLTVVQHGKSRTLDLPFEGEAVLDAGLRAGLDLPYACKGGVCCTCRARVLEGRVRMDRNYTLEAQEIAAGFVLTCQAHPLTPTLTVSYDER
jgi:ring-1,2-phenylacetyl-CoA epoxidase subunit PaaE